VVHGKHKTIKSLIKETDELKRLMGCMHSIFFIPFLRLKETCSASEEAQCSVGCTNWRMNLLIRDNSTNDMCFTAGTALQAKQRLLQAQSTCHSCSVLFSDSMQ
jgi:hypothetical protein